MASSCTSERFIIQQDADCLRSKLIQCVGLESILKVFFGTHVLEDLRLLKDCKPASVSNWSFDESCLFCCLRRENVKKHVVALNKQIVESGGKPLLGKDPSNINRLEWQSEEFLHAVLHRKEYTPRIPDPHIPVVACEIVQQMINQLAKYYTSKNNCSQDFLQNNGKKDQSLLKSSCVTSSSVVNTAAAAAASSQNLVINEFIMADQDAPLDLSLKKIKVENLEQDGVLDLSTKKDFNTGHTSSFRNSHGHVSPAAPLVKRDHGDVSLAQVRDLHSASTLEQFMSNLCLHHQHQIVDALGFLQSEVKTVAPSSNFKAPAPTLSEKQRTTSCNHLSFEARSEIQWSERTCSVDAAVSITKTQESSFVRSNEEDTEEALNADVSSIAPVMTEKPVDIHNLCVGVLCSSSCRTGVECGNVSTPKSPSLFIMNKTKLDHLETKELLGSSIQCVGTDTVKKCLCNAERCLPTCSAESDNADFSFKCAQKCSIVKNKDESVKHPTIQMTSTVALPISPRTARKSRKGSCVTQRNCASNYILNEPDCDLVFIRKSITECQPQSPNRLHPRQNARKSTRGHKYIEEFLELKTVRTLARKFVSNASGNCPAHLPDVHTSLTPKQSLSKPDSVPLMNAPFTGDCMENIIQKLPSEQIPKNEMPGDVVNVTSQGLIVETTQTCKTENNYQISHELACKQSEFTMQQDLITNALCCVPNTIVHEKHKDMVEVIETTETTEHIVQIEGSDTQKGPLLKDVVCGLGSKAKCQDKSTEPSLRCSVSPNLAEDDSTREFKVESRNDSNQNLSKVKISTDPKEQSEAVEIKANTEEVRGVQEQVFHDVEQDQGAQEQELHDVEINVKTANTSKLPMESQGDSEVQSLMEVIAGQPLLKCNEKDMSLHTQKDLDAKMVLAKQAVFSDRCLRSRGSKGSFDVVKGTKCDASELVKSKMTHSNEESTKIPWVKQPLNSVETIVHSEGEHNLKTSENCERGAKSSKRLVLDHTVEMRQKQKSKSAVEKDEHQSPNLKTGNDDKVTIMSPDVLETVNITSTIKSGQGSESSEKMALRSCHNELSISRENSSPIKKFPLSSENMLLRSRINIEPPCSSESSSLTPVGHPENLGQMPLRNNICTSQQATNRDLCTSHKGDTESVMRMPLRNRTSSTIKQTITRDSPVKSSIKGSNSVTSSHSSVFSEQPICSHSNTTCKNTEVLSHMPLRSGTNSTAEMPPNRKSAIEEALESPVRMLLRRGNASFTEKPCGSATPSCTNKRSPRQQTILAESQLSSNLKIQTQKNMEAQIKDSLNFPDESLCLASLPRTEPVVCSPPKFLDAIRGEEHQQLISNLNTKFDKMHKAWIQMDKEGHPAPKHKNKADRLKEIWKSKRRIRKSRSLEQQKFSPVQMLFMKPFDLPSICRWFLESTETKSLVIVKKVNTRLPSETQLCFQTAGTGSSSGIFPSLQAERLKKHLKKFAIASPVKNNPKNQRLISKALGRDISVMRSKEKHEPTTATRISTKAQSLAGVIAAQAPESLSTITGNVKNPASARILRKYSNIREKLQVQQSKKCKEKTFKGTRLKTSIIPKKATKQKLPTRKGAKCAIVQNFKSLTKKAKTNSSTLKKQSLKRNLGHKDEISPKRLQALTKMTKGKKENASTNALSKKEALIKNGTHKLQQTKASGNKVDVKKSVLNKGPNSLERQSLGVNMKPLSLEDQVLTRSQRKLEATPSHTGTKKKSPTKRCLEPLVTPTKRTKTSKS